MSSAFLATLLLSGFSAGFAPSGATPAAITRSIDQIESNQSEPSETRGGRMRSASPEGDLWTDTPWPLEHLSRPQGAAAEATEALRSALSEILTQVGVQLPVIETDHFLVTTDLDREYLTSWLPGLDDSYRRMLRFLGLSTRRPPFAGKIAVIALGDRDRFRLMNAAAFDQSVPGDVHEVMQARGSQTFVLIHDPGQANELRDQIHLGIARAILHFHHAPRRLPLWANEGLAEVMRAAAEPDSPRNARVRAQGTAIIRGATLREVAELFTLGYEQEPWPQADTPVTSVGSLAIRLMDRDRPDALRNWIREVKLGKPWQSALHADFGASPEQFVQTVYRFYTVND